MNNEQTELNSTEPSFKLTPSDEIKSKILEEREYVDIKPYSHNLISLYLPMTSIETNQPQCKGCPSKVDEKSRDTGEWWDYCNKCYSEDQEEAVNESDEDEFKCCMCYDDVRKLTFWGCDICGLNVCKDCAINEDGFVQCGHKDCVAPTDSEEED
jgi:hypothetical protein